MKISSLLTFIIIIIISHLLFSNSSYENFSFASS